MCLPFDTVISFQGLYPTIIPTYMQSDVCTKLFVATLEKQNIGNYINAH